MSKSFCLFAFVVCAHAIPTLNSGSFTGMTAAFEAWMAQHDKSYSTEEEFARRLAIFNENAIRVEEHNAKKLSWRMGLNQFADLTAEEFASLQTLRPSSLGTEHSPAPLRFKSTGKALPDTIDWRDHNAVTPIKNQQQCGSCWAFSTIVSFEGQASLKTGSLVSYSEQDLVDCVKNQVIPGDSQTCCDGCQGGLMDSAFAYMIDNQKGRDDTESTYPYAGVDQTCAFNAKNAGNASVLNYTDIAANDEDSLKEAVGTIGPVSVAVDANLFWQLYAGGVFDPLFCNKQSLNHGVAVVGYGNDGKQDYWIIRNSWGTVWGEKGYMRMLAGKNICGVAASAVFPVVQ